MTTLYFCCSLSSFFFVCRFFVAFSLYLFFIGSPRWERAAAWKCSAERRARHSDVDSDGDVFGRTEPSLPLPRPSRGHLKQPPSRSCCCYRCCRVLGCRKTSLALALTAATAAARQQQWQWQQRQQRRQWQWQLSKPTFHPLFWFFSGYSGGCLRAF